VRENSLWKWLKATADGMRPHMHLGRVENSVEEGYPDVEGCYNGFSFHIELKVADRPARKSTPIRTQSPVKQTQVDWLRERREASGRAWILIQVGTGRSARRYLLDGLRAGQVAKGLTELDLELYSCCGPLDTAASILSTAAYR